MLQMLNMISWPYSVLKIQVDTTSIYHTLIIIMSSTPETPVGPSPPRERPSQGSPRDKVVTPEMGLAALDKWMKAIDRSIRSLEDRIEAQGKQAKTSTAIIDKIHISVATMVEAQKTNHAELQSQLANLETSVASLTTGLTVASTPRGAFQKGPGTQSARDRVAKF